MSTRDELRKRCLDDTLNKQFKGYESCVYFLDGTDSTPTDIKKKKRICVYWFYNVRFKISNKPNGGIASW